MTPQELNAMKLALEALIYASYEDIEYNEACAAKVLEARNALKEALAEYAIREVQRLGQEIEPDDIASILACRNMLDAQPVPPRTWVGLTDEEFHDLQIENIDDPWANFKAIEAKLKENNI